MVLKVSILWYHRCMFRQQLPFSVSGSYGSLAVDFKTIYITKYKYKYNYLIGLGGMAVL